MKSFLMVGAFPNILNNSFIVNFKKLGLFLKYDCLVTSGSPAVKANEDDFDERIDLSFSPIRFSSRAFRICAISLYVSWKYLYLFLFLKRYDVTLIQSLSFYHVVFFPILRLKSKKLYVTVWGSDFNAAGPFKKKVLRFFLRSVSGVSVTSESMRIKLIDQLLLDAKKVSITRFGLATADYLDSVSDAQVQAFKEKFDIPDGIVVMCAPTADPIRQVLEVISSIGGLPKEYVSKCVFLFHVISGSCSYKKEVLKELSALTGVRYVLIDEYLDSVSIGALRNIVDIYINVAVMDQLSGSMMESIYCNSIVLVGSWLDYIELVDRRVDIVTVPSVEASVLSDKLKLCINMADCGIFPSNADKIKDLFFWDVTIEQWRAFLSN